MIADTIYYIGLALAELQICLRRVQVNKHRCALLLQRAENLDTALKQAAVRQALESLGGTGRG